MRVLWLKTELLHPVDKGGRIRTYQMLRAIAREHHVTYLTLDDGNAAPDALALASEYAHEVVRVPFAPPARGSHAFYRALAGNLLSSLPYAISRYRSAEMLQQVEKLAPDFDVVVCDFLTPAVNMPEHLPTPTVLFQHNVEAMIWERHAAVATSAVKQRYMSEQWRRMFEFEKRMCHRFDHVVAVSPQDADVMRTRYGISSVSDVPTGVDIDYFTPTGEVRPDPYELVFTGSMDWMPNDDAMTWFLSDILPLVRRDVPQAKVTIVGRAPGARLTAAASGMDNVTVTGRVPDVRPYLERASVFLVPMRIGGGTRLKIFEAMAMGLPVVSTAIGAEGLPVTDGVDAVLRDERTGFAAAIVELLNSPEKRARIGQTGQQVVRDRFGWQGVADAFMSACESVVSPELSTR